MKLNQYLLTAVLSFLLLNMLFAKEDINIYGVGSGGGFAFSCVEEQDNNLLSIYGVGSGQGYSFACVEEQANSLLAIYGVGSGSGYSYDCTTESFNSLLSIYGVGSGQGYSFACVEEQANSLLAIYGVGSGSGYSYDCTTESFNSLLSIYGVGSGQGYSYACVEEQANSLLAIYGVGSGSGYSYDCKTESFNSLLAIYGVGSGQGYSFACVEEHANSLLAIYGVGSGSGYSYDCTTESFNSLLSIYGVGSGQGYSFACVEEQANSLLAIYGVGSGSGYAFNCVLEEDNPLLAIYGVGSGQGYSYACVEEQANSLLAIYGVGSGSGYAFNCFAERMNPLLAIYSVGGGHGFSAACGFEVCPSVRTDTIELMSCELTYCLELSRGIICVDRDTVLIDSLMTSGGCDSLVPYQITLTDTLRLMPIDTASCDSVCLMLDGSLHCFKSDTIVYDTLMATSGCDTIQPYDVTIFRPVIADTIKYVGCTFLCPFDLPSGPFCPSNDTLIFDTLSTVNGCDSIIPYQWIFTEIPMREPIDTISCDSVCLDVGFFLINIKCFKTDTVVFRNIDKGVIRSARSLFTYCPYELQPYHVTILQPSVADTINMKSCGFASLFINNQQIIVSSDTILIDTLDVPAANGCDSLQPYKVSIQKPVIADTIELEQCQAACIWLIAGGFFNVDRDTVIIDSLQTTTGCDSLVPYKITFIDIPQLEPIDTTSCDSVCLMINGRMQCFRSDTLVYDTISAVGSIEGLLCVTACDDTIQPYNVTISQPVIGDTIVAQSCFCVAVFGGELGFHIDAFILEGENGTLNPALYPGGVPTNCYINDGEVVDIRLTGAAANGCDSIIPLRIVIQDSLIEGTVLDTLVCDSIEIGGVWYSSDTMVYDTLFGVARYGCDSLQPYNVTIYPCGVSIDDPCNCADPLNYSINGEVFYHHLVTVTNLPDQDVCMSACASLNIYDELGMPCFACPDPITCMPMQELSGNPGTYELDIWVKGGEPYRFVSAVNGVLRDTIEGLCDSECIPTSSPNCIADINLSVGIDDSVRTTIAQLLSNPDMEVYPVDISIEDEVGQIIYRAEKLFGANVISFNACQYADQKLKVTLVTSRGTCWTGVTIKSDFSKRLQNNLDTAVWCIDPLITWDPNDLYNANWYTTNYPFTLLPTAIQPCNSDLNIVYPYPNLRDHNEDGCIDRQDARDWYAPRYARCEYYAVDWVQAYDCDQDPNLSKQIIREWSAIDQKTNTRITTTDTIDVYKLPELDPDNFYAPLKDTVYCQIESDHMIPIDTHYICWKQQIGLHPEYTADGRVFDQLYLPVSGISFLTLHPETVIIQRWNPNTRSYEGINAVDIDVSYVVVDYQSEASYAVDLFENDRILTNDGEYKLITRDMLLADGEPYWVDLCLPRYYADYSMRLYDAWDQTFCEEGISLLLPASPSASECRVFCLDEAILEATKCFTVAEIERKDLGGSCPRVVKKAIQIKQICTGDVFLGCDRAIERIIDTTGTCNVSRERIVYPDESGIVDINSVGGSIVYNIEQWTLYIDTLAPLFVYEEGRFTPNYESKPKDETTTWSMDSHDCYADVRVPDVRMRDNCSGVKSVKATVYEQSLEGRMNDIGYGWVNLTNQEGEIWSHVDDRPLRLPYGTYRVYYEYLDSCHNGSSIEYFLIEVQDHTAPTVLTADTLRVSIGAEEVWLDVANLDKGSADNCGIRMVLGRRVDWQTACGVDLCDAVMPVDLNSNQLDARIKEALSDNAIEAYYADMFNWLSTDDYYWCEGEDNYVVDGWRKSVVNHWAENCNPEGEHGGQLQVVENPIGGGWGTKIPICCEDACQNVIIELLVIDKACNYSKGWLVVEVEDKSAVELACKFENIEIGCTAYQQYYADMMEAAESGDEQAMDSLDGLLGELQFGKRGINNSLVDDDGQPLTKTFDYLSSTCELNEIERKVLDTTHDGEIVWKTIIDYRSSIVEESKTAALGGVFRNCHADAERSVWVELNDCGVGKITRRWVVNSGCSGIEIDHGVQSQPTRFRGSRASEAVASDLYEDRLVIDQVIYITSDCKLSKSSLEVPNDTLVCGELSYTLDGNVELDVDSLSYSLADRECRQLGISHRDQVFTIVGEPNLRKIHRTWKATDWCNNQEVECVQKIILNTNCENNQVIVNSEQLIVEPKVSSQKPLERSLKEQDNIGRFELYQNAPNPFTESTVIRFELPEATKAKLSIYDLTGRVLYIQEGEYEAGLNQVLIENSDLSDKQQSGVLILQLETATHIATKQLVLSK